MRNSPHYRLWTVLETIEILWSGKKHAHTSGGIRIHDPSITCPVSSLFLSLSLSIYIYIYIYIHYIRLQIQWAILNASFLYRRRLLSQHESALDETKAQVIAVMKMKKRPQTGQVTMGVNTMRPGQNGRHLADDIFILIFLKENCCILAQI